MTTFTPAAVSAAIFSAAVPFPARDDRAGMSHPASGRRRLAGDEADDRLLEISPDPRRGVLFRAPADFADHDDRIGVGVGGKERQRVDEGGADQRIPADPDARRLAQADPGELMNGLVGEGAALRDDADAAFLADVARDDAGLGLARAK